MSNPFSKKLVSTSKNVKKYLTESLIGPSNQNTDIDDDQFNDMFSNSLQNPSKPPDEFARSQSLLDFSDRYPTSVHRQATENTSLLTQSLLQPSSQESAPVIDKEESQAQRDLFKYIKGDYFSGGKTSKEAKSFILQSPAHRDSQKEESIMRSESLFQVPSNQLPSSSRHRKRIGSIEIEVKDTGLPDDSGRIFDYILHYSEISFRSGPKNGQKIFINSYLDMPNLRSDDISQYFRIRARAQTDIFDTGNKNFQEKQNLRSIVTTGNQRAPVVSNPKQKDKINKETLDLIENYVPEEEEVKRDSEDVRKEGLLKKKEEIPEVTQPLRIIIEIFDNYVKPVSADAHDIKPIHDISRGFFENIDKRRAPHNKQIFLESSNKIEKKHDLIQPEHQIDALPEDQKLDAEMTLAKKTGEVDKTLEKNDEYEKDIAQEAEGSMAQSKIDENNEPESKNGIVKDQEETEHESALEVEDLSKEEQIKYEDTNQRDEASRLEEEQLQAPGKLDDQKEEKKEELEMNDKNDDAEPENLPQNELAKEEPKIENSNSKDSNQETVLDRHKEMEIKENHQDLVKTEDNLEIENKDISETRIEDESKEAEKKTGDNESLVARTEEETNTQEQENKEILGEVETTKPSENGVPQITSGDAIESSKEAPKDKVEEEGQDIEDEAIEPASAERGSSKMKFSPQMMSPEQESEVELDDKSDSDSDLVESVSEVSSRKGSILENKSILNDVEEVNQANDNNQAQEPSIKRKGSKIPSLEKKLNDSEGNKEEFESSPLFNRDEPLLKTSMDGLSIKDSSANFDFKQSDYFKEEEEFILNEATKEGENIEAQKLSEDFENRIPETVEVPKEKTNIPIDPLDTFDEIIPEGQIDSKFNLEDYKIISLNPLAGSYKLNTTSISPCKGISEYFESSGDKKTKKYEATVVKIAPPDFIFVGTTSSTVLVFDSNENLKQTLKYNEGPQQSVTAIDCRTEETPFPSLVVGLSGGHLVVFELKNFTQIKSITSVQTGKITSIRVTRSEPVQFVASDETGQLVRYKVQKSLWKYTEEHRFLLANDTLVFDIQIMSKDMRARNSTSLAEEGDLRYIFALAKHEKVVVIDGRDSVLGDTAKAIYTFDRPEYVEDIILPSVSWGNGSFNKPGKKTFLAIGWGSVMHLVNFTCLDSKPSLVHVGHYVLTGRVIRYIGWINENIIGVVDQEDILYFVNSEEFIPGELGKEQIAEGNNNEEMGILNAYPIGYKLKSKLSFMGPKKSLRTYWGASISTSWVTHEMMMIADGPILKVRSMNALEYLESLAQNKEWLKFFTISLQIYKLNSKEFRLPFDINKRKDILFPLFKERTTAFLENDFKERKQGDPDDKEIVLSLIDFFTEIDFCEFLFTVCQKKLAEFSLEEMFLDYLEPFLVNRKIKNIPNDQLISLVNYYCKKGKKDMIQKFLKSLNFSKQDSSCLLNICLEHGFYEIIIEICSEDNQHNFTMPVMKLLALYESAKVDGNQEKAQEYGYRCLWYLKRCLNNDFVLGKEAKKLTHEEWKDIIFKLMQVIFEPKNLRILFEIDGEISICFMLLFFIGDLTHLVEERYGDFIINHPALSEANSDDIHYQVYQTLVYNINSYSSEIQKNLFIQYLGFFHGKVAQMLRYAFLDRILCVEFVKKFIISPFWLSDKLILLWEKYRLENEGKTFEDVRNYFDENVTASFVNSQRTLIILDLLKYCQYTLSPQEINILITKAKESNIIEIECVLLAMKFDYQGCLDVYLAPGSPSDFKNKVFEWISQTIRGYHERSEKSETEKLAIENLRLAVIEKLPLLISIDQEKTKETIDQFLSDKMSRVIRKLKTEPRCQLEVLEKFISKHKENMRIDPELLVLHIHLLAKSDKKDQKRIKQVLEKSNRYPLDVCLEICQTNGIKDAWAYLEFKQGNIDKAIELTYEIVEVTIRKYFEKENFKYAEKRKKVFKKIRILLQYLGQLDKNPEECWFQNLIKLYILIDENLNKLNSHEERTFELKTMKREIIEQMLDNIVGSFGSREVLRILETKDQKIPERLKGKILTKIILHNAHDNFILEHCESLVREDIYLFNNLQLFPKAIQGTSHFPTCQTCYKEFHTYEHLIWFGCGHIYHASDVCCPQEKCSICRYSMSALVKKIVSRFTLSRMANYLRPASSVPQNNREAAPRNNKSEVEEARKSEKIIRNTKDTKNDGYQDKLAKFHHFAKQKNKKQKEINSLFEKCL